MKILCLASLLCGFVSFAQDSSHPLGLKKALQMALEANPSLHQMNEKIVQSETQIPYIRANLFPSLSLINTAATKKDAANSSSVKFDGDSYNQYQTDLHLSQPLLVFGSLSAVDSAKKDRELRKIDYDIARRDLTNQVLQAYYLMVLDMRNIDTLLRQEKIEKESLVIAEKRSRTGRGQLLDVLQVKTELALLASQITDAKNQLQVAAAQLANLLGDNQASEFHVKDSLESPGLEVVSREVNLKNFRIPELEKNQISMDQIGDLKSIAHGSNWPSLTATGDYYYTSYKQSDLFSGTSASWSVGLQLTIPLFSGLSSVYQQRSYASQLSQLKFDRMNIENETNLKQVTSRKKLESAHQSIIAGQEALKLATASSKEASQRYAYATIDFVQFLSVQKSYVQAESALNNSKYNYIVALANYFVASGQDIAHLIDLMEGVNP